MLSNRFGRRQGERTVLSAEGADVRCDGVVVAVDGDVGEQSITD